MEARARQIRSSLKAVKYLSDDNGQAELIYSNNIESSGLTAEEIFWKMKLYSDCYRLVNSSNAQVDQIELVISFSDEQMETIGKRSETESLDRDTGLGPKEKSAQREKENNVLRQVYKELIGNSRIIKNPDNHAQVVYLHRSTGRLHMHALINKADIYGQTFIDDGNIGYDIRNASHAVCKAHGWNNAREEGVRKRAGLACIVRETAAVATSLEEFTAKMAELEYTCRFSERGGKAYGLRLIPTVQYRSGENSRHVQKGAQQGSKLSELEVNKNSRAKWKFDMLLHQLERNRIKIERERQERDEISVLVQAVFSDRRFESFGKFRELAITRGLSVSGDENDFSVGLTGSGKLYALSDLERSTDDGTFLNLADYSGAMAANRAYWEERDKISVVVQDIFADKWFVSAVGFIKLAEAHGLYVFGGTYDMYVVSQETKNKYALWSLRWSADDATLLSVSDFLAVMKNNEYHTIVQQRVSRLIQDIFKDRTFVSFTSFRKLASAKNLDVIGTEDNLAIQLPTLSKQFTLSLMDRFPYDGALLTVEDYYTAMDRNRDARKNRDIISSRVRSILADRRCVSSEAFRKLAAAQDIDVTGGEKDVIMVSRHTGKHYNLADLERSAEDDILLTLADYSDALDRNGQARKNRDDISERVQAIFKNPAFVSFESFTELAGKYNLDVKGNESNFTVISLRTGNSYSLTDLELSPNDDRFLLMSIYYSSKTKNRNLEAAGKAPIRKTSDDSAILLLWQSEKNPAVPRSKTEPQNHDQIAFREKIISVFRAGLPDEKEKVPRICCLDWT